MRLDALKDFSWYNEPENVRFNEAGMVVEAAPQTDFWANRGHRFFKDDGHFFYQTVRGDFSLTVQWESELTAPFAQCGIMARFDSGNWVKASWMTESLKRPNLGSVVTTGGCSDWSVLPLPQYQPRLWFKLRRRDGDFILFYSLDGARFEQWRLFRLEGENPEIKIGAYAANPDHGAFHPVLETLEFNPF